jgi:flagellin
MSDNVILSAAVRQNLLALQDTASLMASTQQRLATGKKVNSALDNPSAFFTSQSLSSRASDLQNVLNQIGQAVQTINAANNGITSITQLVQSAKSLAQQATATTAPVSTYSSVDASSNILSAANLNGVESTASLTGDHGQNLEPAPIAITGANLTETLGQGVGGTAFANDAAVAAAFPGSLANDGTVQVTVASRGGATLTFNVALNNATDQTKAALLASFNTATDGSGHTLGNYITASYSAGNDLQLTANDAAENFAISAAGAGASTAATLTAVGLNGAVGAHNSTDLLTNLNLASGAQLVISGQGPTGTAFPSPGATTITFGTGAGQVATLQDLNTALAAAATGAGGGFSAAATPTVVGTQVTGHISITASAGNLTQVTVGGSISTIGANATYLQGATAGTVFSTHDSQPTLQDLGNSLPALQGGPVSLSNGGSLSINVNGTNYNVGLAATGHASDTIAALSASALGTYLTFTQVTDGSGHNHIQIAAKDPSVNFTVNANGTSAALGLTANTTTSSVNNSTSLLSLLNTKLGGGTSGYGTTLTVAVNGGITQTITFGTATGQVQTIAELNTQLGALSGVTASVTSAGALDINVASGTTATSLTLGGTATGSLGLLTGTQNGTILSTTSNASRASLQSQYNNVLTQIDTMAKDSSFNGVNLLGGDNLTIAYNSDGSSSQTITGTIINAANLGLNQLNGTQFQDNTQLTAVVASTNTAINTLATQGSQLGSALTTVQARQTFTTAMINTLQTGSDNLVLADTNQEGANMLALQTRQQLSTTALSLANQANQAVLRLFG